MAIKEQMATRLAALGRAVRSHLARTRDTTNDHVVVGAEGGDTIFAIDRMVEPIIVTELEAWPEDLKPLLLVAEGFGATGHRRIGGDGSLRWRLLVDPIDGTRGLMYDKRAAWFLAAAAPDRGTATRLSDAVASAMVELPTSKQAWADVLLATRGGPARGLRERLCGAEQRDLLLRPSREPGLRHGFGQVTDFFPGTRALAADLMERIATTTLGKMRAGDAALFNDQYISSGGQMAELILGHDRFCCDLRPLFFDILERRGGQPVARGIECHPYDIAGLLVAEQAAVVVTNGFGRPLDADFDVTTGVHWCGYANDHLRQSIEPVILTWLAEHGIGPER